MNNHFELEGFIANHVTGRSESLFSNDIKNYHSLLAERIDNKSVLVIGGAGTIGSNFVKAILKFKPSKLYIVDINENGLTELVRDLRSSLGYNIPNNFKTYPINFGDRTFSKIIENEGPFHIVANFAAHKHVRSEKDRYSIEAMVDNNVLKAKKLLDILMAYRPERFFCVSTDKAANPVNVMGASKKIMEEVILAYSKSLPITTARFANVAFSNGSLPFGFLERIQKRQPLSAPMGIKRYFVSPTEAGQLCLIACVLGESGDIFFPKLNDGNFETFTNIAERFLKELGLQPKFCKTEDDARRAADSFKSGSDLYPVYFFPSDTSGEKSFEEFYTDDEQLDMDRFEQLGVIKNAKYRDLKELEIIIDKIEKTFDGKNLHKSDIVQVLQELLPNFSHIETGKSLDQKM